MDNFIFFQGVIHNKSALLQSETKTWYHTGDKQLSESEKTKGTDMYVCMHPKRTISI